LTLFGLAFLPLYAYPSRAGPPSARLGFWFHRFLLGASVVAVLSGVLWLACTTANMTGAAGSAADWEQLGSVLRDTDFGHTWIVRLGLSIVILGLAGVRSVRNPDDHRDIFMPLLAGVLLVSLAATGHTQHEEGMSRLIHESADGAHLLAAGAWLGGLLGLGFILAPGRCDGSVEQPLEQVLLRFSGMGYVAVAVLVASGVINSWFLVGSVGGLLATPYGQVLLIKLFLFAGMVALAASNRFWLVPGLIRESESGQPRASLIRLRRHVLGEQSFGLIILVVVSVLGTMEPAASQMKP
jgi:putative copper resistance protein D